MRRHPKSDMAIAAVKTRCLTVIVLFQVRFVLPFAMQAYYTKSARAVCSQFASLRLLIASWGLFW